MPFPGMIVVLGVFRGCNIDLPTGPNSAGLQCGVLIASPRLVDLLAFSARIRLKTLKLGVARLVQLRFATLWE
jgi:hypothetical protein